MSEATLLSTDRANPHGHAPFAYAEVRDLFDDPARPDVSDASLRVLKACATAYARWFGVVRAAIRRERVRQQLFREEHGLPKSARLPYVQQPLTASEQDIASYSEDLIRLTFGDTPADYAHTQFLRALATGDMRAFKIRLLILKTRDTLHGSGLYRDFVAGQEFCITLSEQMAGCKPDPSPRRLSCKERDRRRKSEEHKAAIQAQAREVQEELPLEWKTNPGNTPSETLQTTGNGASAERPEGLIQDIEIPHQTEVGNDSDISIKDVENGKVLNKNRRYSNRKKGVTVTGRKPKRVVVRKVREYENVEQIMEDIHDGKIVPYDSTDEISADVVAGKITQVDALMFAMALDRYKPTLSNDAVDDAELESEFGCGEDGEEEFGDGEDDYEEPKDDRRFENRISYNPHGFCGCSAGHYSDCGTEWNTDDD